MTVRQQPKVAKELFYPADEMDYMGKLSLNSQFNGSILSSHAAQVISDFQRQKIANYSSRMSKVNKQNIVKANNFFGGNTYMKGKDKWIDDNIRDKN